MAWFFDVTQCCGFGGRERVEIERPNFSAAAPASFSAPSSARLSAQDGHVNFTHSDFVVDNAGRLLDFYKVDRRQLGEGSFGTVAQAVCKKTLLARAVKTVPKAKIKVPERLHEEVTIMRKLDHPHIVRLIESFEDVQNVYLIMEICEGGELFDRLIKVKHFTEKAAAGLIEQMLRAISYMHLSLVCHRDLKPENFLLTRNTSVELCSLQLIDFGLSKRFVPGTDMTSKVGSVYYVSPQVISGRYDQACDCWSLGVILFIMLSGKPPFKGANDTETFKLVKRGAFQFHPDQWGNVSASARALIRSLLHIRAEQRLTAPQALEHDWVIARESMQSVPLNLDNLVSNLQNFKGARALKKAGMHAIAVQLDENKIQELRKQFEKLDKNGDGRVSPTELEEGLMSRLTADIDLRALAHDLDTDGNGMVDYTEFLATAMERRFYVQENVCWEAFRTFDRDGSGTISPKELQEVLTDGHVQKAIGPDKAKQLMEGIDTNSDGVIDFKEFMIMMKQ